MILYKVSNVHVTNASSSIDFDTCSMEGAIRLINGSNATEGTVEVCNGTRYGTVCDDHWDELDARVVCRQLGYGGEAVALKRAFFGSSPSRPIYLDNVRCNGSEPSLLNCTGNENEVGMNNCDHSEDAGVRCNGMLRVYICAMTSSIMNSNLSVNQMYLACMLSPSSLYSILY